MEHPPIPPGDDQPEADNYGTHDPEAQAPTELTRTNTPEQHVNEAATAAGQATGDAGSESRRRTPEASADPEQLEQLLFALEREIDEQGWDQPPTLFALNRVTEETIAIQPLHPIGIVGHATTLVQAFTEFLAVPEVARDISTIFGSDYMGLLLTFEGWGRYGPAALTIDTSRSLADQVGSVECRTLLLRTVEGQQLMVERVRGHDPALVPTDGLAGALVDALNTLAGSINETLRNA